MKTITTQTSDAWLSGDYVGANRPMMRATVQKLTMTLFSYEIDALTGWKEMGGGKGKLASAVFGQAATPVELPNIKSIRWSRSIDQDVATCTIVLYNTAPLALGQAPLDDDLDQPGYYTPTRGATGNRWGYLANAWRDRLVPDAIIRTYEGYGFDATVIPELDTHMYPSGTWLIDAVKSSPNGALITLECRDYGRMLLDQIMFPPVVPWSLYPLYFERFSTAHKTTYTKSSGSSSGWRRPRYSTDSNIPYVGSGITDGGHTYVSSDGSVYGHHGRDAFDGSNNTYWLSVGNRPTWSSAYEYVQGSVSGSVGGVRVYSWGGPYTMYVSVKVGNTWQGAHRVPYRSRAVDSNADIPYVKTVTIGKNQDLVVKLPKTYTNVTAVRVTFSHLYNSGLGYNYRYRAGVRDFEVGATVATTTITPVTTSYTVGNYQDYTDIIKWLVGWGGFYWPKNITGWQYFTRSDGVKVTVNYTSDDPVLGNFGRIWGDFEQTGTNGPAKLIESIWDKKPLMDGIAYIRDIVGFLFYIDESGGVVWRSPNVFSIGNYIWAPTTGSNGGRTTSVVTIDERVTLMDLTPSMSSKNVRERIFVGNASGGKAAVSAGFNPYPSGLRRVGGWTDQHFATDEECQIMADMITLRQAFEYRTFAMRIPGNPAIQIDDQVQIFERISGEQSYHRIRGVTSSWDVETGVWTYDLDTHWLGETPFTRWAFNPDQLSAEARAYLQSIGKI